MRFQKQNHSQILQERSIFYEPHEMIGVPLKGRVILHLSRIFLGNVSSLTVSAREFLVEDIIEPVSLFDEYDELEESSEEES